MLKNNKSSTFDLENSIFPIYDGGKIIGQGFIADGYFITAGHILKEYPFCRICIHDSIIELSKYKPLYFGEGDYHDPEMLDVAIFRFDGINSLLHLSNYIPQKGEKLENYCMHENSDRTSLNPKSTLTMVPAYPLGEEEGNYFYCTCDRFGGSSGSPLIKENEVVGIMHGGNETGLCAFLKVKMIQELGYSTVHHSILGK